MVYSTRRFVVCLSVCHFVLMFFSPFSIAITSLGEERANLSAFRTFVRACACLDLSVSSSSWGLGRAAVCDFGTPWTFLLPFLQLLGKILNQYHAKCMHFAKMQLVSKYYTLVLYEPIFKLYMHKNSAVYLSDCRLKGPSKSCILQLPRQSGHLLQMPYAY